MDNSLFSLEEGIIERNKEILTNEKFRNNPMYREFKNLLEDYENLLQQMKQMMDMSDGNKAILRKIQNELLAEVKERKQVEKRLGENIYELNRVKDRLEKLSITDELTGLANRRKFEEVIDAEWNRSMRREEPISVIMVDVDFFKRYNDTYGRLVGDECLQNIAAAIKEGVSRTVDFVARYGGEEFVVVLPGTDNRGANIVAEKMRKSVESLSITHEKSGLGNHITISLGVATIIPVQWAEASSIVEYAEEELNLAKKSGRNQIQSIDVGTI